MFGAQVIGGLLQKKPGVPAFKEVDAQKEQAKAIKGNIDSFAQSSALGAKVNQFNQDQLMAMIEKASPGTFDLLGKAQKVTSSMVGGELPQGVIDQIKRRSAEFGAGSGVSGSQFQGFAGLRQLGLESLDYTQRGLEAASNWIKGLPVAPQFNASSMFLTPEQQINHSVSERDKRLNRKWLSNQINAAYAPGTIVGQALIKTDDQIMQMASSVAGGAAGAAI